MDSLLLQHIPIYETLDQTKYSKIQYVIAVYYAMEELTNILTKEFDYDNIYIDEIYEDEWQIISSIPPLKISHMVDRLMSIIPHKIYDIITKYSKNFLQETIIKYTLDKLDCPDEYIENFDLFYHNNQEVCLFKEEFLLPDSSEISEIICFTLEWENKHRNWLNQWPGYIFELNTYYKSTKQFYHDPTTGIYLNVEVDKSSNVNLSDDESSDDDTSDDECDWNMVQPRGLTDPFW